MPDFDHLLSPCRIGPLELPNRLIMAAMATGLDADPDRRAAFFAARAAGGTALVVAGAHLVSTEVEPASAAAGRIDGDEHVPAAAALADAVHRAGGLVGVQLTAGWGRLGPAGEGRVPVSASPLPAYREPAVRCRALSADEVGLLVHRHGQAAARLAAAGVDLVEVLVGAGHLLDQFATPAWNQRTDGYGGDEAGRHRFAVEVVRAVRAAAPGLAVAVRLGVDQHLTGGRTRVQSQRLAVALQEAGAHLVVAEEGSEQAPHRLAPPYYLGDGCAVPAARALTEVLDVPVAAVGNLTPEVADRVIAEGDAALAAVGRGLVADPRWVRLLRTGRRADLRPCIRCNTRCVGSVGHGGRIRCAVNPVAGYEGERRVAPAGRSRHVVVVGGGPAGLEAARVAAARGHRVDLYERGPALGGVLWPAATAGFKQELRALVRWWERQTGHLGVRVHLGHEVTADGPEVTGADAAVLATGGVPNPAPEVPRADDPRVLRVLQVHRGAPVGHRVVLVGGGLAGSDAALELAEAGHEVTVVDAGDRVAADCVPVSRSALVERMAAAGVRVLTGCTLAAVTADGVRLDGPDGPVAVPADTVVTALGMRPDRGLPDALADAAGPQVVCAGDCVATGKVGKAVTGGFLAALSL